MESKFSSIDPTILKKLDDVFKDKNLITKIIEALENLGVDESTNYDDICEKDLEDFGIKRLQARKFLQAVQSKSLNYSLLRTHSYNSTASPDVDTLTMQMQMDEESKSARSSFIDTSSKMKESLKSDELNFKQQKPLQPLPGSVQLKTENGLTIYRYPLQDLNPQESFLAKNILVVGQTGVGKTTFLEFLLNYVSGVQLSDNFRYQLPVYGVEEPKEDSLSQTQIITFYNFKSQVEGLPDVRVIDTPGFEDTSGIQKDEENIQKIKNIFENQDIAGLNLLCLIMQATTSRLTPSIKYVFSRVLELFATDVKSNIIFILTFADAGQPVAESVIFAKGSPLKELFVDNENADSMILKCNNSAIRGPPELEQTKSYWKTGQESFQKLFQRIKKSKVVGLEETRSLWTLKQIISEVMPQYKSALMKAVEAKRRLQEHKNKLLKLETDALNKILDEIKIDQNNKNLIEFEKDLTIICKDCSTKCHEECQLKNEQFLHECQVFSEITDKCHCCGHMHQKHFLRRFSKTKTKSAQQKIDLICIKCDSDKSPMEKGVKTEQDNFLKDCQEVRVVGSLLNELVGQLEKIKLKTFSAKDKEEYYRLIIDEEKRNKTVGWEERVKYIEELISSEQSLEDLVENKGEIKEVQKQFKKVLDDKIQNQLCSIF